MDYMKKLFILSFCIVFSLEAVSVLTIEEKNKQADTDFLKWKRSPEAGLSKSLRSLLTDDAIKYIVDQSQLPFSKVLSDTELREKVNEVAQSFIKKYDKKHTIAHELPQLKKLITQVIKPESVFQVPVDTLEPDLEQAYDTLITSLKDYKTPVGTTLQDWALKLLTSESIMSAIPFIEKTEFQKKSFNQLSDYQKEAILKQTAQIIARNFIKNLAPVQAKFKFNEPARLEEAIEGKVLQFIRQKITHSAL